MKACLIRCPMVTMPYPPDVGLGYLNGALKAAGVETRVLDYNWELFKKAQRTLKDDWLWRGGAEYDRFNDTGLSLVSGAASTALDDVEALLREGFGVFGFSVWHTNQAASLWLAQEIKARRGDARIVFGGPQCQPRLSGKLFAGHPAVDAVAFGEAEETAVELLRSLERSCRFEPCPGAYVREGGRILCPGRRAPPDPMRLARPDFSGYSDLEEVDGRIGIMFNRGCVRRCRFCSVPGKTPEFRWRSADDILAEIKSQVDRHGIRRFFEMSPTTNSNMRELVRLCDRIIEEKIDVRWQGWCIFTRTLTTGVIRKMRRAGCVALGFGLESASPRVLGLMSKRFDIDDAERTLKDCVEAGIRTLPGIIVGYPGETEEDFRLTMDFVRRNAASIGQIGSITPMHMEAYAPIVMEGDGDIVDMDANDWSTKDGSNTPEIREDRARRMRELAASLGLFEPKFLHKPPVSAEPARSP